MFKKIALALVVAAVALAAVVATRPSDFRIERSTTINASPEKILPHIIDFHKWAAWSPWDKMDPAMKREYTGAAQGVGAKYGWSSKGRPGEGSMEIKEVSTSAVKVDLRFVRPFKNDCIATFLFAPQGNATNVRWTMDGPNLFMGKVMSLFHVANNTGIALYPMIGGLIGLFIGWRATFAVTEITPWPPIAMVASAESSLPL